jgi:hypothetical protein
MEEIKTDTPQESNFVEKVAQNDVAESGSLLGQEPEPVQDDNSFKNPLTEDGGEQEEKRGEDKEKKETVSEAVNFDEITLHENFEVDDDFKSLASDVSLSKDQIEKLIGYKAQLDKQNTEKAEIEFKEVVEGFKKETKEIYGADLDKSLSFAARALNLLPVEEKQELQGILNSSGIGNHPLLVKMFVEAGKALSEDKFIEGKAVNNNSKSTAQILFGNKK